MDDYYKISIISLFSINNLLTISMTKYDLLPEDIADRQKWRNEIKN